LNILITGGNGYIAKSLFESLKDDYDVTAITRKDFDLCNKELTKSWFKNKNFEVVIHTAIVGGSRLVPDDYDIVYKNLSMYHNLLDEKDKFKKFISFGSGAEIFSPNTPYGISKKIIAESISKIDNFYNMRIFGIFDENELDRRFIKSNLKKYIKNESMVIHSNKVMDFFYMRDFISLVRYYIESSQPPKEIDCCYEEKYTLYGLANIINGMGDYKVPIVRNNSADNVEFYCGRGEIPIRTVGVVEGIRDTYNELKKQESLL
jgi:nucleoside-diphosphate-sugar epimerase